MNTWFEFSQDRRKLFILLFLISTGLFCTYIFSCFMVWNEAREGFVLNDPILNLIAPIDLSIYTSLLTNIPIFTGLIIASRKPEGMMYVFMAAIIICILRIISIFVVPLDPPTDIIPLRDVVIEQFFYQGNVILKDLFFSGHTANLVIVALLVDVIWIKRALILVACIVGALLIVQHVHYSIDVFAAPFFAIMSYKLGVHIVNNYFLNDHKTYLLRSGRILQEFGFKVKKDRIRDEMAET